MKREELDLSLKEYLFNYSAITNKKNLATHVMRYKFANTIINRSDIVLDIGCGEGFGANILANKARRVFGVDYHKEIIDLANNKYSIKSNLGFQVGDCVNLGFEEEMFDAICAFDLIEHLSRDDQFLKNIKRILKKNGKFIISTPNKLIHLFQLGKIYEFHYKEYFHNEINQLISKHFQEVSTYIQNPNELYEALPLWNLFISRAANSIPPFIKKAIKKSVFFLNERFINLSGEGIIKHNVEKPVEVSNLLTCSDLVFVASHKE